MSFDPATLVGTNVAAAAGGVVDALGKTLDRLFTSDEERLNAQAVLEKLRQHPAELQVEINKIEASHRTVFVAGWRPFIGWICGSALAYHWIVRDLMVWLMAIFAPDTPPPPSVDVGTLMTLLLAMLGMAKLRTDEKTSGVTR